MYTSSLNIYIYICTNLIISSTSNTEGGAKYQKAGFSAVLKTSQPIYKNRACGGFFFALDVLFGIQNP